MSSPKMIRTPTNKNNETAKKSLEDAIEELETEIIIESTKRKLSAIEKKNQ